MQSLQYYAAWAFWIGLAYVGYVYAGYPLLLCVVAKLRPRPHAADPSCKPSVSFVIAAHNEAARVARRIEELSSLIRGAGLKGEIILVSDGSTDRTEQRAALEQQSDIPVHVIALPQQSGKAVALTAGCAKAQNELIVLADARQTWAPDALAKLAENFADPRIGGVSGDLVLEKAPGVRGGVGLYWRYEKAIRKLESSIASSIGVTGAICAVRRELFTPIPAGTILDDVFWPMQVVAKGYRIVHDQRAEAFDRLPARSGDEFRRKVRTLSGNFQLVVRCPSLLLPWRNPVWIQFVSHKLARLGVPWVLMLMIVSTAIQPGWFWRIMLVAQIAFYTLGVFATRWGDRVYMRPASPIASFLMLNAAAWTAFWVWATGRHTQSWGKAVYK